MIDLNLPCDADDADEIHDSHDPHIIIHPELIQGSEEWLHARLGLLTASAMKSILSPTTRQPANNATSRALLHELLAQRINGFVEPSYVGDDMLRGNEEEILAREVYEEECALVTQVGFITRDTWGFTLGYSPDGLVGQDGLIEAKSRRQKFQLATILEDEMPDDYIIQVQTGLLVSDRKWCDFISYCGGMPMFVKRIYPDLAIQDAIVKAATAFEEDMRATRLQYEARLRSSADRLTPTNRVVFSEITI